MSAAVGAAASKCRERFVERARVRTKTIWGP
jgi:hypothetical protein